MLGYGLATAALPFLVGIGGLAGFYVAYALIAAMGAGSNVIAYVRVLSGWFSGPMNNSRGLALGISSAGLPLGAAASGPIGVLLTERFGWQGGYWGLALIPLLVGLPVAFFGIRLPDDEQAASDRAPASSSAHLPGMTLKEAMRTRPFWLLASIVLLMSTTLQGIGIHTVPLLSDYQLAATWVAIVLALDQVLGIAARVGAGFLFDRFFAPRISIFIFGLAAAASFALVGFPGLGVAIAATLLITVGSGAESDFVGYLVGRYFGLKCYGQIFGTIYAMFMVGIAIGPLLFGIAFDRWGDYKVPFTLAGLGLTAICGLLLVLPRYPADYAHKTD
jgi:predicted MFS family arabinose efflux permease